MRLIHGDNYSVEEKKEFARLVHRNIFNIMRCMIDAMKELKITFANETSFVSSTKFELGILEMRHFNYSCQINKQKNNANFFDFQV